MDPVRFQRVRELFEAAIEQPESQRGEFLDRECGSDRELRDEVADLLAAHDRAGATTLTETVALDSELQAGQVLSERYRISRTLAGGGFGVVYLADDTHVLNKHVVVKVLRHKLDEDGAGWFLRKFRQECEALARIDHPGVIGIRDQGETPEGQHFLVLDYVHGAPLRSIMAPGGLPLKRVAGILRQLGEALHAAHAQGVCHRDLKPENIMLKDLGGGREMVVVIDFGVAVVNASQFAAADTVTRVAGSFPYMAPEQLEGHPDVASDIYAMAVIAYELLAGDCPFRPSSPVGLYLQQKQGVPRDIRKRRGDVPEDAERILIKALAFDAKDRYDNAAEFGDQLACALTCNAQDAEQTPPKPPAARRRTVLLGALGMALAALTAAGIYFRPWARPAPAPPAAVTSGRILEYYVVVQKFHDGKPLGGPFRLAGEMLFPSEYHIRLMFSSPQAGYFYLVNEAPAGELNMLYPSPAAKDGSALLAAGEDIPIPSPRDYFVFDEQQGEERLWMIWSRQTVPELEAVKKWVNAADRGRIRDTREGAMVRDFLSRYAGPGTRVTKDEAAKRTILSTTGEILVNLLKVEHH